MGTQRCRCMGTLGSPAVTSPHGGRFLPRPCRALSSPRTLTPLSDASLCPPRGAPAPLQDSFGEQRAAGWWVPPGWGGLPAGTPGGWGRGTPGHGVLAPSSHFLCALRHGRGQSSLSRHVAAEGRSCPPLPFWGSPHRSRCLYQSAVTAQVLLLQDRMVSVSSISPTTYGLSCPRGSVLGRGSPPRSPSGSMRPPARSGCPQRPVRPGGSHPQPAPAAHTTGTTAPVKH